MPSKRKICFVITSKIHYTRNKLVLEAIRNHPDLELQIVVGGSALIEKYGLVIPDLEADGFKVHAEFLMSLEGGTTIAMAKGSGVGLLELPTILERLSPDIVLVRGDRYEVLPVAIAAAYMNITVAHIEGGDVTGTIDESVRHAVTKLSHIHLATNDHSAYRIIRMGEPSQYVFNVGSPEMEFVASRDFQVSNELINFLGVGEKIDLSQPYAMVLQHGVTSEVKDARAQIEETLHAINDLGIPTIWFWPNVDAGTDDISKGIRAFREKINPQHIHFLTYRLDSDQFYALLQRASCLIGNSSSGFKEAGLFGVPVVNIGTRQTGRYTPQNVINVPYERHAIMAATRMQVAHGPYPSDRFLHKEGTSMNIAKILADIPLYSQKQFRD